MSDLKCIEFLHDEWKSNSYERCQHFRRGRIETAEVNEKLKTDEIYEQIGEYYRDVSYQLFASSDSGFFEAYMFGQPEASQKRNGENNN